MTVILAALITAATVLTVQTGWRLLTRRTDYRTLRWHTTQRERHRAPGGTR